MPTFQVKNWSSFQSYKDRKPSWLRLHVSLIDNFEFFNLSEPAQALLPLLWIMASEHADPTSGIVSDTITKIAFRLRRNEDKLKLSIDELVKSGFLLMADENDLSNREKNPVVYFIRGEKSNRLKIGFSERFEFRLKEIARSEGEDFEVIGFISGTRSDESNLHEKFSKWKINGEWFQYVTETINLCNEVITNKQISVTPEKRREEERRDREENKKGFEENKNYGVNHGKQKPITGTDEGRRIAERILEEATVVEA